MDASDSGAAAAAEPSSIQVATVAAAPATSSTASLPSATVASASVPTARRAGVRRQPQSEAQGPAAAAASAASGAEKKETKSSGSSATIEPAELFFVAPSSETNVSKKPSSLDLRLLLHRAGGAAAASSSSGASAAAAASASTSTSPLQTQQLLFPLAIKIGAKHPRKSSNTYLKLQRVRVGVQDELRALAAQQQDETLTKGETAKRKDSTIGSSSILCTKPPSMFVETHQGGTPLSIAELIPQLFIRYEPVKRNGASGLMMRVTTAGGKSKSNQRFVFLQAGFAYAIRLPALPLPYFFQIDSLQLRSWGQQVAQLAVKEGEPPAFPIVPSRHKSLTTRSDTNSDTHDETDSHKKEGNVSKSKGKTRPFKRSTGVAAAAAASAGRPQGTPSTSLLPAAMQVTPAAAAAAASVFEAPAAAASPSTPSSWSLPAAETNGGALRLLSEVAAKQERIQLDEKRLNLNSAGLVLNEQQSAEPLSRNRDRKRKSSAPAGLGEVADLEAKAAAAASNGATRMSNSANATGSGLDLQASAFDKKFKTQRPQPIAVRKTHPVPPAAGPAVYDDIDMSGAASAKTNQGMLTTLELRLPSSSLTMSLTQAHPASFPPRAAAAAASFTLATSPSRATSNNTHAPQYTPLTTDWVPPKSKPGRGASATSAQLPSAQAIPLFWPSAVLPLSALSSYNQPQYAASLNQQALLSASYARHTNIQTAQHQLSMQASAPLTPSTLASFFQNTPLGISASSVLHSSSSRVIQLELPRPISQQRLGAEIRGSGASSSSSSLIFQGSGGSGNGGSGSGHSATSYRSDSHAQRCLNSDSSSIPSSASSSLDRGDALSKFDGSLRQTGSDIDSPTSSTDTSMRSEFSQVEVRSPSFLEQFEQEGASVQSTPTLRLGGGHGATGPMTLAASSSNHAMEIHSAATLAPSALSLTPAFKDGFESAHNSSAAGNTLLGPMGGHYVSNSSLQSSKPPPVFSAAEMFLVR